TKVALRHPVPAATRGSTKRVVLDRESPLPSSGRATGSVPASRSPFPVFRFPFPVSRFQFPVSLGPGPLAPCMRYGCCQPPAASRQPHVLVSRPPLPVSRPDRRRETAGGTTAPWKPCSVVQATACRR